MNKLGYVLPLLILCSCSSKYSDSRVVDIQTYASEKKLSMNGEFVDFDDFLYDWSEASISAAAAPLGTYDGIDGNPHESGSIAKDIRGPLGDINCSRKGKYKSINLVGHGFLIESIGDEANYYSSHIRTPEGVFYLSSHRVMIPDGRVFITAERLDTKFLRNCQEEIDDIFSNWLDLKQ